jgi:hypothetical protein
MVLNWKDRITHFGGKLNYEHDTTNYVRYNSYYIRKTTYNIRKIRFNKGEKHFIVR